MYLGFVLQNSKLLIDILYKIPINVIGLLVAVLAFKDAMVIWLGEFR